MALGVNMHFINKYVSNCLKMELHIYAQKISRIYEWPYLKSITHELRNDIVK